MIVFLVTLLFYFFEFVKCDENVREDNFAYYYPTDDGFKLGYAYHAPSWWGARIKKEKSFRIAFIGGSQTRGWR